MTQIDEIMTRAANSAMWRMLPYQVTKFEKTAVGSISNFNISDGRVDRASAPRAVDSGLISSRFEPTTLKLVLTACLFDV